MSAPELAKRSGVPDAGVAALPVVEDFTVPEDCSLGLRPRFELQTVNHLLFQ